MKDRGFIAASAIMCVVVVAVSQHARGDQTIPFEEASLVAEINATDGDAGVQPFLDHEPWRHIAISRPDGTKIIDVQTLDSLQNFGLTELFSESSEPPFDEFPIEEFKALFPEGDYIFEGETIDGQQLRSEVPFSHDFPNGPKIKSPKDDSIVDQGNVVVRWSPGPQPQGVEIKGWQVIVERESGPFREFSARNLPASARSIRVPAAFMEPGVKEYKAEVLAIEKSGNQTLSEVSFSTS